MSDLQVGSTLDGLFRLDRLLGTGGAGAVYAAWHLNLDRAVAVKLLHPQLSQHKDALQRFLREAQLLSRLGHVSFVQVFDFSYTQDGAPYLVMELIAGETLRERLARGPLPLAEAFALFKPLCEALGQAHQQQILHRDIKPENLMLTPSGVVKILDFGMAKLLSDDVVLTADKVVMGTPYYMAPERAKGKRDADHRVDVFALGAILYEVLAGRMAFEADTPLAAMYKVIRDPVPKLGLPDEALSGRLDQVIARACAKKPEERYQSTQELWRALDGAVRGEEAAPGIAPAATPPGPSLPLRSIPARQVRSQPAPAGQADSAELSRSKFKAGIFHAILDYIRITYGDDGILQVSRALGRERVDLILKALPNEWIDPAELHDLHDAINSLFDDGSLTVMRNLGRHFADLTLTTVYKAFLVPGSPEVLARRAQVMYSALSSVGQMQVEQTGPDEWCMKIVNFPMLSPSEVATNAGWIRRYLELAGGTNIKLRERFSETGDGAVGEVFFSFAVP